MFDCIWEAKQGQTGDCVIKTTVEIYSYLK